MKRLTREWVSKAEQDFLTARRAAKARRDRLYDIVCFHAQQCIEKYLKGLLQESGLGFGRTHDLTQLGQAAASVCPGLARHAAALADLTDSAVKYRYPGAWAAAGESKRALGAMTKLRSLLRRTLGLRSP